MLQGEESEKGDPGSFLVGRVDTQDTTLLFWMVIEIEWRHSHQDTG